MPPRRRPVTYDPASRRLEYIDETGDRRAISTSPSDPWKYVTRETDISDVTGALVTSGLEFSLAPSTTYLVQAWLLFTSAATTTGLQWTFGAPTSGTAQAQNIQVPISGSTQVMRFGPLDSAVMGTDVGSIANTYLALGTAIVIAGATPVGAVTLEFRTEVAASAVTILAGSFLRYRAL